MIYQSPCGDYYNLYRDMLDQPHLLIAGATGSGKSVVINALMYTALYRFPGSEYADSVQFVLIDPKRVELVAYRDLPHTIRYASEPDDIVAALQSAMQICDWRYQQMQRQGVRRWQGGSLYIVIDEFADLMTTNKRAIQPLIQRIAQIGRAASVRIILATQTPIAKILPTEVKCNFDARVALRTRSAQDSRNITGFSGCENLPRYGRCYYMTPECEGWSNVPMYSDEQLQERINWWVSQKKNAPRKWWNMFRG